MAKARPGGPDYIYALLTGYQPPAGFELAQGMHYNTAFPGHQIAMPPPLIDGSVPYTDGQADGRQLCAGRVGLSDVGGRAKLEERHMLGARVMVFLIVFAIIMFLAKRAVGGRCTARPRIRLKGPSSNLTGRGSQPRMALVQSLPASSPCDRSSLLSPRRSARSPSPPPSRTVRRRTWCCSP